MAEDVYIDDPDGFYTNENKRVVAFKEVDGKIIESCPTNDPSESDKTNKSEKIGDQGVKHNNKTNPLFNKKKDQQTNQEKKDQSKRFKEIKDSIPKEDIGLKDRVKARLEPMQGSLVKYEPIVAEKVSKNRSEMSDEEKEKDNAIFPTETMSVIDASQSENGRAIEVTLSGGEKVRMFASDEDKSFAQLEHEAKIFIEQAEKFRGTEKFLEWKQQAWWQQTHKGELFDQEMYPLSIAGVEWDYPKTFEQADGNASNPNFSGLLGDAYSLNCQTCVFANEMRRRGYNIEALGFDALNSFQHDLSYNQSVGWKKQDGSDAELFCPRVKNHTEFLYALNNFVSKEKGARYTISFGLERDFGHIINLEIGDSGSLLFFDPQSNHKMDIHEFVDSFLYRSEYKFINKPNFLRIDNLIPKDDFSSKVLQRSSKTT